MEGNITISRVRSGQPASMRHGLPHRVRRRKAAQRHARIAAEPLKLKLLSRNSMRLEWIATELGSQLGLASGTAVLTRRQER